MQSSKYILTTRIIKIPVDIEAECLKIAYPFLEFKNKFLNFIKEVWYLKHPKKWGISYINELWK